MTKYVNLLFMSLVSIAAFAQRTDPVAAVDQPNPYAPGRWYVGLRHEYLPFRTSYVSIWTPGAVAGYNLLPKLSVQVGFTPTNLGKKTRYRTAASGCPPAPLRQLHRQDGRL